MSGSHTGTDGPGTADLLSRVSERVEKRKILRASYGVMLALPAVFAVEAYRIQSSVSRRTAEIYQRHIREEALLCRFRRILFLGSIYARTSS